MSYNSREFPDHNASGNGFSHTAWRRANRQRMHDDQHRSHKTESYRVRLAEIILLRLGRGELSAQAAAAVERDYKKEFKHLRAKNT